MWLHTFSSNVTDYNHLYFVIKLRNILCNSLLPNTAYNTQKTMVNIKYEILYSMQYAKTQFFTKSKNQIHKASSPSLLHDMDKNTKRQNRNHQLPRMKKKEEHFHSKNVSALFSVMSEVNYVPWPRAL